MRLRKIFATLATGTTLALSGVGTTVPAVAQERHIPAGYDYVDDFYWHEDCVQAGEAGRNGAWRDYMCINGSPNPIGDDYELWVRY